jgi:hypothetical protein
MVIKETDMQRLKFMLTSGSHDPEIVLSLC